MTQDMTRRRFLQVSALPAVGVAGLAESAPTGAAAPDLGTVAAFPWRASQAAAPSLPIHALSRLAYGHTQADLDAIRAGTLDIDAWFNQQLAPDATENQALTDRLAGFESLGKDITQLITDYPAPMAGVTGPTVNNVVIPELLRATILRKVYSKWQLREVMIDFWTDHFNIYLYDDLQRWGKLVDDREVIRANALGNFHSMLRASAASPAMITYLDNNTNRRQAPNENYAREVMELHTLSVNGPYNQSDVQALARCFTGWTVYPMRQAGQPHPQAGQFRFNPNDHDTANKTLLGRTIIGKTGAAGIQEAEEVLGYLAAHPATARFIATKLVRKLVADDPPQALVDRVADTFLAAADAPDQIAQLVRLIYTSDEFRQSAGQKTKRPLDFVVAAARALGTEISAASGQTRGLDNLYNAVRPMGQPLYGRVFPDGYADVGIEWVNTNALLSRWNLGLNLAKNRLGQQGMVSLGPWVDSLTNKTAAGLVDALIDRVLGYAIDSADRDALIDYASTGRGAATPIDTAMRNQKAPDVAALLIASPYFQAR